MFLSPDLCGLCCASIKISNLRLERLDSFLKLGLGGCSLVQSRLELVDSRALLLLRLLAFGHFLITECLLGCFLVRLSNELIDHLLNETPDLLEWIGSCSANHLHQSIALVCLAQLLELVHNLVARNRRFVFLFIIIIAISITLFDVIFHALLHKDLHTCSEDLLGFVERSHFVFRACLALLPHACSVLAVLLKGRREG